MRFWLIGSAVVTIGAWVVWLCLFSNPGTFPDKMPIHWDIHMQPDAWAHGTTASWWLMMFPGVLTLFSMLAWLLPALSPDPFKNLATRTRFDFAMFASIVFFSVVGIMVYEAMRTGELPVRMFLGALFLFIGVLGGAMHGLKPNPWFGVRLPWTTNNEAVWDRTHTFAAQTWGAMAVIGIVAVALGAHPAVCLIGFLVAIIIPVPVSYMFARAARKRS